jgi:transcriptional regulator of heat shock response
MKSFGTIKTSIEKSLVESYGKPEFKTIMKGFKKNVLDNKNISEMYFIYDALSKPATFNKEIVSEYINESTDILKSLVEKNTTQIEKLSEWIDNILSSNENNYSDIDTIVYNESVRNLEKVLESKKQIKNILILEEKKVQNESVNIPLSSMLKIASNVFNEKYSNISEEEQSELKSLLSLTKEETSNQIKSLTEEVVEKLKNKLVEEKEDEMKVVIETTISRVKESKNDLVSLFKLKQLNSGL